MNRLSLDAAKHAVQPEPRDTRDIAAAKDPHHPFKHQLEKAKPAKKPADQAHPAAAPSPAPAAQPDSTSLAQIIAALLAGAAKPGAEAVPDAKPVAAIAAEAAAANAKAGAAQGAPDALLQKMVAVAPEAAPDAAPPAMTPLEQAVHDLLSELADKKTPADDTATPPAGATLQLAPSALVSPDSPPEVQPTAAVAPPPPPAELVSQNHAHLVFDDPNGRVVMTVAVRGSEVNVSVRATDDATAASLARNAASLDDAMRGRGLQLAQFDAQRDLAREQHAEKPKYERETVKKSNAERFTLEENP